MRIATLQFAPKLGDLKGNIEKANDLLKSGKTVSAHGDKLGIGADLLKPDVLVLPELALTGMYLPNPVAVLEAHEASQTPAFTPYLLVVLVI